MPSRARWLSLLLILLASTAGPLALVRAEPPGAPIPAGLLAQGLVPGETGRVVEIVDGDTLILAEGRQVRLVGIQVTTRFAAFHPGSFCPP